MKLSQVAAIGPTQQDETIGRPILDMAQIRPAAVFLCEMGTTLAFVNWQLKPMASLVAKSAKLEWHYLRQCRPG